MSDKHGHGGVVHEPHGVVGFRDLANRLSGQLELAAGDTFGAAGGATHAPDGVLGEMAAIVEHQWREHIADGLVKGFLLAGPPGIGKTTVARRLAYELGCRFSHDGADADVNFVFVDAGEIARSRYGDSERRISEIFRYVGGARPYTGDSHKRFVLLFDDVESIFMSRESGAVKEWHFSQDNVFFHSVDDLDTSRATVLLTSNRADLVDEAVRDRFVTYELDYPDPATLADIGTRLARRHSFSADNLGELRIGLTEAAVNGTLRSIRDVQRFVLRYYVERVVRRQPARTDPGR